MMRLHGNTVSQRYGSAGAVRHPVCAIRPRNAQTSFLGGTIITTANFVSCCYQEVLFVAPPQEQHFGRAKTTKRSGLEVIYGYSKPQTSRRGTPKRLAGFCPLGKMKFGKRWERWKQPM